MKKKISVILFIILCFCIALPAFAETESSYYRVIDMADLLSDSDEASLIEKLDDISSNQSVDVVVATTDNLEGYSIQEYADLLYEQCNFGYGSDRDGLMLLIDINGSNWYISTCGYGITAFTDAGIEYIGEQIKPELSDGDYYAAFEEYAELSDDFITQAKNGNPYNSKNLPSKPLSIIWIPAALVIGFIIANIIVGGMKSQLKTVRKQVTANSYVKKNSMNITENHDLFLYRTVTKTEKVKNDSSSDSTTHSSSSGTTHGGGGGKF